MEHDHFMHLNSYTPFQIEILLSFIESLAGTYELIPYYKGENTVFDVSPPVMSVTVEHQHVTIPQTFQVKCIVPYKFRTQMNWWRCDILFSAFDYCWIFLYNCDSKWN